MQKLTEKQKRFCDYYIENPNATESAVKAGYSKSTAKNIACENLTKPYIKAYIDEKLSSKDKERIASQDEVLEFYSNILRGKENDNFISFDAKGNIVENKIKPMLKEKLKAADALAKRYGLDKPYINLENTDIKIDIIGNNEDGD